MILIRRIKGVPAPDGSIRSKITGGPFRSQVFFDPYITQGSPTWTVDTSLRLVGKDLGSRARGCVYHGHLKPVLISSRHLFASE